MANHWDSKASRLVAELEEEEKKEKQEADKALGRSDAPEGPPVVRAQRQMRDLDGHSEKRKQFMDWSEAREAFLSHKDAEAPVELTRSETAGKAVRIKESSNVTYVLPEGASVVKLMFESCSKVQVELHGRVITSSIEVYKCADFQLNMTSAGVGCIQVDSCTEAVVLRWPDRDSLGQVFHQGSPGLSMAWGASEPWPVGVLAEVQMVTQPTPPSFQGDVLVTTPVRRGEGEFPLELPGPDGKATLPMRQPESEALPGPKEGKRRAEEKRMQGNEMFRANDFMQAAMAYTEALDLDDSCAPIWANRAACWMKLGDHEKSLADATKCTEMDLSNAKGWFRKGMSLHAMKNYKEAVPALLEAENLEPTNKQVAEAIKMSQLMARKEAGQ